MLLKIERISEEVVLGFQLSKSILQLEIQSGWEEHKHRSVPRKHRGAGFGATATAPMRLAGCSAWGPDG